MKVLLSKSYQDKRVLEGFALEIPDQKVTCVLGASGVGKTTLLNILAGLTTFEGEMVGVPKEVGYIFQEARLLPNLTVKENLLYAGAKESEIDSMLQKVGLFDYADKKPTRLSGGERQRVAVARAFLSHAPLLLLDEPFSSLDTALKIKLCAVFGELWKQEKSTVVMVTHDLEEALMLGHKIVILKNGKIEKEWQVGNEEGEYPVPYGEENDLRAEILRFLLDGSVA